jgi:hypothetical protein
VALAAACADSKGQASPAPVTVSDTDTLTATEELLRRLDRLHLPTTALQGMAVLQHERPVACTCMRPLGACWVLLLLFSMLPGAQEALSKAFCPQHEFLT